MHSSELEVYRQGVAPRPEVAMGPRSLSTCLALLAWGVFASSAQALTQPPKPKPFKIWVSVEEEREEEFLESIRKLRVQEEKLAQFLEQLRHQGVEMDDPRIFLIYRELRDLRRRIWRLERERFR
jgi:hypothetical protein